MPCTYYTPEETARIEYEEKQKLKAELDKATRLLCEVMTEWSQNSPLDPMEPSLELEEWWKEHKEKDKARLKAEEAVKALAKEMELAKEKRELAEYKKLHKKYGKKSKG